MYRITLLALAACAILTGCSASTRGYSFLRTEQADRSYQRMTMHMTNGEKPVVYLKTFEEAGKLGLCGYYTNISGTHDVFFCSWLKQAAHVELRGENVSSAGFLIKSEEKNGRYSGRAFCVVTDVPYSVDLAYSRPNITGFGARVTDGDC